MYYFLVKFFYNIMEMFCVRFQKKVNILDTQETLVLLMRKTIRSHESHG